MNNKITYEEALQLLTKIKSFMQDAIADMGHYTEEGLINYLVNSFDDFLGEIPNEEGIYE